MAPTETLYFVHISDTHFGPTKSYARHGHRSYPCAQRLVETINALPQRPDFVIHSGDVTTDPTPEAYALAAEALAELEPPIYYVTGNHDRAKYIHEYLPMGPKEDATSDPGILSYTFEMKGYRFLALDARGPDEIDPHGVMSSAQLNLLRREAAPEGPPLAIFIHYPFLPLNSIWMDAYMLVINGETAHQALFPARERLRGVFHGHVHQPMQTMRDGILYVSAASAFAQFSAWPQAANVEFDLAHPPGYGFVHLTPQQTIIHQHTFPRPGEEEK